MKRDWQIISEIATGMGYPMHYNNTQEIWDELRDLCPVFYGATYEKMGEMGYVQWPCRINQNPITGRHTSLKRIVRHPEWAGAVLHLRLARAGG